MNLDSKFGHQNFPQSQCYNRLLDKSKFISINIKGNCLRGLVPQVAENVAAESLVLTKLIKILEAFVPRSAGGGFESQYFPIKVPDSEPRLISKYSVVQSPGTFHYVYCFLGN